MGRKRYVEAGDFIRGKIVGMTWETVERLLFVLRTEKLTGYTVSFDGILLRMFAVSGKEVVVSVVWLEENGWVL